VVAGTSDVAFGTQESTITRVNPVGYREDVLSTDDEKGVVRRWMLVPRGPAQVEKLLGHKGLVQTVAISPDLRWVASSGEDNTLRLWPMADLSRPPLHTLPHRELLAKLKSLTNFRAVHDPKAPSGWAIEVGPFPGWRKVSDW
jgi:WD40 repeat protein